MWTLALIGAGVVILLAGALVGYCALILGGWADEAAERWREHRMREEGEPVDEEEKSA